ncbi:transcriptional-regulating factor 1 isoform X2 [Bombina bombina]|uniref:transcriptional-regulating factor 1 isoform X2 n=1 Tax=Bombina bombina TaxID=8345 RepID=UPI00235B0001|nr:transcriptional-regulating factor 1 isoform X2 [Bombina bombina]
MEDTRDNLYYQQVQQQASRQSLNHSYDSLDMNASESSSSSPHLSQDSGPQTLGPVDSPRQTNWSLVGSEKHMQMTNNINSYDPSLQWNLQTQNEATDNYQATYFSQLSDNQHKMTSGALHKLDSFTQVFSRQNLRIHSQGVNEQSSQMVSDSALRQLLSLKPTTEQQTASTNVDRYQQVPQQMQQSLANQLQKHQSQTMQHVQQHYYYDYPQNVTHTQSQSLIHQGQQFAQQIQHHQGVLPQQTHQMQQTHYYMQQQSGQQRISVPEIQTQQRQFSGDMSQYYQSQSAMPELQHTMHQQQHHHMHLQQPYQRNRSQKNEHYAQNQSHPMQLIQLGTVPQYIYQNSQPYRHSYKQSMVSHQQHMHQESNPLKPYHNESRSQALMDIPVELSNAETLDNYNREDMSAMGNIITRHPTLPQEAPYLLKNRGPYQSPNISWPQHIAEGLPLTDSLDHRGAYPERPDSKTRLTCSVCFKEFRSLPALNGHLRSHGGVRSSVNIKQEEGEQPQVSEGDSLEPIVMPVSVPVKLAPPDSSAQASCSSDKDQPESCMSDNDMPVLTRMTYSPPSSPKADGSCASSEIIRKLHQGGTKSENSEESVKPQQEKRKYRHRPEPLFIPPPSFIINASHSGATLYQSQLRSPRILEKFLTLGTQELLPYTPPPMLSPVRQGSGLFSNVITASHNAHLPLTPLTPTPRVLLCRPNSIDGSAPTVTPGPGEQTVDVEPRINIGAQFQAQIPELQSRLSLEKELPKATMVWKPLLELENMESQHRVDVFLNMSCSSVLPGGGTNLEYALHSLFEANGDIMGALEKLLLQKPPRLKTRPLANYHYAGSDKWTVTEKKNFNKGLITYNKDFFHVQKMIKSKTVSQCVEYYYTWKRILHMVRKHRTRIAEINEDDTTSVEEELEDDEDMEDRKERVQKSPELPHTLAIQQTVIGNLAPPTGSFVCETGNCGAMFCSRQALNGHARIHGGTSIPGRIVPIVANTKQKPSSQSGYCSVKSSPAHSTTSGETDHATVFPCKVCGKVFFKIKSRNAHMKTHRQQEEQQRQKAQKAVVAAEMADTISRTVMRTTVPEDHSLLPFDHLSLIKNIEQALDDDDVAQDLEDVLEREIINTDLLLDDEDAELLQDTADL